MSEQMHSLEPQRLPDLRQLTHEPVGAPQSAIIGLIGLAAAHLIVENHRPLVRQLLQRLQVIVRIPWAAMQREQRDTRLTTARNLVPDLATLDGYVAYRVHSKDGYLATAGMVVYAPEVAARIAKTLICPLAGVWSSIVPRCWAVAA